MYKNVLRWTGLAALVLTLLLLPRSVRAQTGGTGQVTADQVNAALPQLEKLAQQVIDQGDVPGMSIAVVFQDKVVYLHGFGVREAGKPDAVDGDTVFQLASMSKPIGATVVSAIVGSGAATWDDPVILHDPGFQMYDPWVTRQVTLRDFYSHRSGLLGSAGDDLEGIGTTLLADVPDSSDEEETLTFTREQILHQLRYMKPASSFRTTYAYSNWGMTEAGVAAALAVGKTFEDASDELLFKPLGMTETSARYADFLAAKNRAALHVKIDGKWAAKFTHDPQVQAPAGGYSSSARDIAEWMRLILGNGMYNGKQLISADALNQTHIPVMARGTNAITGNPRFYGLGWGIEYDNKGRVLWSHAGAFSQGARTNVLLMPSEQLGIVVLASAFPSGVPEAISNSFYDLVDNGKLTKDWVSAWNGAYDSLAGAYAAASVPYANPPAQPAPALPNSAYVGTYSNDYFGNMEIVEQNGGLVMELGPAKTQFPLTHFDRDVFTYVGFLEPPEPHYGAVFTVGPDGTAQQVVLPEYNQFQQGIFTRVQATK